MLEFVFSRFAFELLRRYQRLPSCPCAYTAALWIRESTISTRLARLACGYCLRVAKTVNNYKLLCIVRVVILTGRAFGYIYPDC